MNELEKIKNLRNGNIDKITYKQFETLVKKLANPSLNMVFKILGVSSQLGRYYLEQAIVNPAGKIKKKINHDILDEDN